MSQQLSPTQYELLELMAASPRGYHTLTAEGSKDMLALAMRGYAHDVYEMAGGGFIGSISKAGREALAGGQMSLRGYYGNRRCVGGRLMRHDPQHDDPDLETDIGECLDCGGKGCPAPEPATISKPVMMCGCGAVLESPAKYAEHCRDFPSHFTNT